MPAPDARGAGVRVSDTGVDELKRASRILHAWLLYGALREDANYNVPATMV